MDDTRMKFHARGQSMPKKEAKGSDAVFDFRPKRSYSMNRSMNYGNIKWDFSITGDSENQRIYNYPKEKADYE